ncbi:MAG TPA: ABC transporter permease [Spirochaetia bacterium]|nr:ABC transporter permease [Spirochaetales bacterium]HRW23376.1 ABC transporter permease [Spirochaetia bacterium]
MEAIGDAPDRSLFERVGKDRAGMEAIERPNLTYWQDAWRRLKANRMAVFALCVVGLYVVMAVVGPWMTSYSYTATDAKATDALPSAEHWFGTDMLGRDLWSRVWMGARTSLMIGFVATLLNTLVGGLIGGVAGYYGGAVDMVLMRVVDVLYGIPYIIVAILMMVVMEPGMGSLIVAMVVTRWIGMARFVRGEVMRVKESDFVAAARVLGASDATILVRHIMPNLMGLIITNTMMAIPNAIFTEAFLSFIGLGIQPPECSWGLLAREGSQTLSIYPLKLFFPAFFISTTMLALNLLGDGLRDALDPRLRGE